MSENREEPGKNTGMRNKIFLCLLCIIMMGMAILPAEAAEQITIDLGAEESDNLEESDESDEKQSGWVKENGRTYYYSPDTGKKLTGWQTISGKKYYFSKDSGAMQTGWQKISGKKYYFSKDSGVMQTGWQRIDGHRYYFSDQSGVMRTGWQKIGGKKYYLSKESGRMRTGRQRIGKNVYFFRQNGVLQTSGWVRDGKYRYYSGKSGALKSGWQDIGSARYYFSKKNYRMLTGQQKIGSAIYIFRSDGRLARSGSVSLVTVGGKIYCAAKDGKAASGWQFIGDKLYYASRAGEILRNTTYQGVTFASDGTAVNGFNVRLKTKVRQIFSSITNAGMSQSQKLNACWSYMVGSGFRYALKYPNLNASGWTRQTAYDMLTTRCGNCYSFACAFAALAAEAGYQPYIICGRVRGSRDHAADGYTRHAWVRINGLYYDPEAQFAGWLRGVYARSGYPVSHSIQRVVAY